MESSEEEGEICIPYDAKKKAGSRLEEYDIVRKIGEGTFGKVYLAYDTRKRQQIALKKITLKDELDGIPIAIVREIKILRSLRHKNVIEILDIIMGEEDLVKTLKASSFDIYVSFPYMKRDLASILKGHRPLAVAEVGAYTRQILEALVHVHSHGVVHRDLKPANILIDGRGLLKIADFGLARSLPEKGQMTPGVVTRWYRSPELLLGSSKYDTSIDMWSCGCVIGEMLLGRPLLPGNSEINQLELISEMCGSINELSLPSMSLLPNLQKLTLPPGQRRILDLFSASTAEGADIIDKMLVLNPWIRLSARDALSHPFLSSKI